MRGTWHSRRHYYGSLTTFRTGIRLLRQEERQAILHEGSGAAAVNAYVEIIFDNSDQRFAQEASDEVVLRRTIGLKKDEFFLNRKKANKQEIQSLLEGAGISKSNPYNIVQQGKIQDLCTMSDKVSQSSSRDAFDNGMVRCDYF